MKDIFITGGAMTPFGRHSGVLAPELAQHAILKAMDDAGVEARDIQAIYCANVLGGMILGQLIVRDLGFGGIPVYNVENACASGATAVHLARHAMLAEQYDTALVFGIEQLTALGGGTIPLQRNDHKTELYAKAGMVLPAVYAMRGTRFLHERSATPADLAAVAVKNRHHGSLNEYAQQRAETTVEEVLASRMIADPLTLLQCCPSQVDGAAAVVLRTRRPAGRTPVKLLSSVVVSGIREQADDDILDAEITARAARQAYEQAGLGPQDLDVVELHDAFTIAELLYYEALGLAPRGGCCLAAIRRHAIGRPRAGEPQRRLARQGASARRHRRRADGRADVAAARPGRRTPGRGREGRPDPMHRRRHCRRRPCRVIRSPAGSVR